MKRLCAVAAIFAATGASAADINSGMLAPPEGYRWEGAYLGGNIGGTWSNGDAFGEDDRYATAGLIVSSSLKSTFTGGLQAGYNYQVGKIVAGFEGDVAFGGAQTEFKVSSFSGGYFSSDVNSSIDWYGSLRVRLGLSPSSNILVYATAGIAFGYVSVSLNDVSIATGPFYIPPVYSKDMSSVNVGWIAGAGAEYSLSRAWSIRAEALYMNLGTVEYRTAYGQSLSGDIEMGVARAGLNYQF